MLHISTLHKLEKFILFKQNYFLFRRLQYTLRFLQNLFSKIVESVWKKKQCQKNLSPPPKKKKKKPNSWERNWWNLLAINQTHSASNNVSYLFSQHVLSTFRINFRETPAVNVWRINHTIKCNKKHTIWFYRKRLKTKTFPFAFSTAMISQK